MTVDEALTRILNTISKVNRDDKQFSQQDLDSTYQNYTSQMVNRLIELNSNYSHRPEVIRYAIFKTLQSFIFKFKTQHKVGDFNTFKEVVLDFIINVFDRIHCALPHLQFKELAFGFACSKNILLIPEPVGNQPLELCGFKVVDG